MSSRSRADPLPLSLPMTRVGRHVWPGRSRSTGKGLTVRRDAALHAGEGTNLVLTYALGRYVKDGFEQLLKAADGALADQVTRLKREAEAGLPQTH